MFAVWQKLKQHQTERKAPEPKNNLNATPLGKFRHALNALINASYFKDSFSVINAPAAGNVFVL